MAHPESMPEDAPTPETGASPSAAPPEQAGTAAPMTTRSFSPDDPPDADDAARFLRSHFAGDLRFDEHLRDVKWVYATDGRMVLPVMVAMTATVDTVLFVPEAADGAMEVQVSLEPFEEKGEAAALCDRWRIHHGEPPDVRWAYATPDAAKWHGLVVDGVALLHEHPFPEDEPALLRRLNERVRAARDAGDDRLQAAVERVHGVRLEAPMVAGIDGRGIDVRGKFDVKRLDFADTAADGEAALAMALAALGMGLESA